MVALWVVRSILGCPLKIQVNFKLLHRWHMDFRMFFFCRSHTIVLKIDFKRNKSIMENYDILWQCATFPIDRGPDLGKNWVGLGKLSNLVARWSMVISCVLLHDRITGLQAYTVGLWWIIITLDRWSMTSANTISHTAMVTKNLGNLRNSMPDRCPRPAKTASVHQSNCLCWSKRPAISSGFWKFTSHKYCSKHVSKFKTV